MNCQDCQEFISHYLDGELDEITSSAVSAHLSMCDECVGLFDDFRRYRELRQGEQTLTLPNTSAMWCRIKNVIDAESKTAGRIGQARTSLGAGI